MADQQLSSDINISKIPVSGLGGLGLVAMAAAVAWGLPELRWLAGVALVGGAALGLTLIAVRNRRARRDAAFGGVILGAAVTIGFVLYFS